MMPLEGKHFWEQQLTDSVVTMYLTTSHVILPALLYAIFTRITCYYRHTKEETEA